MIRYNFNICECFMGPHIEADEDDSGEFVRYDDYKSERESLTSELAVKNEKLSSLASELAVERESLATALARAAKAESDHLESQLAGAKEAIARRAAESALASARDIISCWVNGGRPREGAIAWLTSHPAAAPVAAPACERSWCKPDNRCADCTPQCTVCGRWSGHCGCVVPAPVAAPKEKEQT